MVIDILSTVLLVMGLLALAWFIKGELSKVIISVKGIEGTLHEMQRRLEEVHRSANASHRRLDTVEKDLLRVKVLQEHLH